jgi:ABC-type polysaccharide/polyol phosphate transport system ATPase subunit
MANGYSITATNIAKKYRIFKTPKDRLKEALSISRRSHHKEFWALQDVSFSLKKGTTLGIMGVNGSGKSTLLKIVCSYLVPTRGSVKTNGRISSILELGTGFNRDFTGRENVVLYGG